MLLTQFIPDHRVPDGRNFDAGSANRILQTSYEYVGCSLNPRSHVPVVDRPVGSDYRRTNYWNTGKHRPIHTTWSFGRPGIYRPAAGSQPELTTMTGRRPVAGSTR